MVKFTFTELLEKVRNLDRKTNAYVLQQFWNSYSQSSIPTTIASIDIKTNEHVLQHLFSIYSQSSIPTLMSSKGGKIIEYNEASLS